MVLCSKGIGFHLFVVYLALRQIVSTFGGIPEDERVAGYEKRGYQWPIPEYVPSTEGWKQLMDRRFSQIAGNEDLQQKWDGYTQMMGSALTIKNYTEFGWGLTQGPPELSADLRQAIHDGLPRKRSEGYVDVIDGPAPWFIDRRDLTRRVLRELQPILEAWSGIQLKPAIAYGFRLYRNESRLWMHVDLPQDHVISCIYHIASSEDSKPWPIVIEDYAGNTNSALLKPGDVLLYESAKNFHGRPSHFNGEWYSSIFVHYYPADPEWMKVDHELEAQFAVPPNVWLETKPSPYPKLEWVGTSALEPECTDSWCKLVDAVEWEGPGVYGQVLTTGGKKYSLGLEGVEAQEL